MKRREFNFSAASAAAIATGASIPAASALAQGAAPRAGKEYAVLDKRVPVDAPAGKVEVIEFFWYSCPHCNVFEPTLAAWVKNAPKDIVVRRIPVAFQSSFVPEQKLFFTLETLGRLDDLHVKAFQAIHAQKQKLNTDELALAWATKQGVDAAKFKDVYGSFAVSTKVRRAAQLQEAYRVEGVPSMGVAGRYYTDGNMAGNMERVLQVVEFLATESRKA